VQREKESSYIPVDFIEKLEPNTLIKFATFEAIRVGINEPEKIPYVVNILESVAWNVIDKKEYEEYLKGVLKQAENYRDLRDRAMFIANEKLKYLIIKIMEKGERTLRIMPE
jgi:hypothetical protein